MLETIQERVKQLKRGFTGKDIERAYLITRDMQIINKNILFYPIEDDVYKISKSKR